MKVHIYLFEVKMINEMKVLSIVVPCYNEQTAIKIFYNEIIKVSKKLQPKVEFEIIFVDDGSKDNTLHAIKEISEQDVRVKYISFSRNFGKESAMYAGLKKAKGDLVAIMDVDLQDPPELLYDMYNCIINEECDCVAARRVTRKGEPLIRSFFARCFYSLVNRVSNTQIVDGARDYRLMTRQMVDSIISLKEYNRFSKGIFSWVGYNTKWIEYENVERVTGETKWSFWKLFIYSLDGIIAFSTAPLALASVAGILLCFLAFIFICIIIVKTLVFGDPVDGYPSLICVIMFIGGVQLFCIGILGQYIARIYLETKKRPLYIIKEEN